MPDSRIERYARLLVEQCVDVQPGWQVVVSSTPLPGELPDIDRYTLEQVDAAIQILAPENTREATTVPADRLAALNAATEFVAAYEGRELTGIRLRFEAGRVVEASADGNEAYLLDLLERDDGARFLGELGFGCNPGIDRYLRNRLFDEKMDGTVHLALGRGFSFLGGTNESAIHWDIVKDLRSGGRIEADGEVVQSEGRWQI